MCEKKRLKAYHPRLKKSGEREPKKRGKGNIKPCIRTALYFVAPVGQCPSKETVLATPMSVSFEKAKI